MIAAVWLHQGAWAKVLARDPRHEQIVSDVPMVGPGRARPATIAVGTAEVALALWILSARRPIAAATTQTVVLVGMNAGGLIMAHERIPTPTRMVVRNLAFLAVVWAAADLGRSR